MKCKTAPKFGIASLVLGVALLAAAPGTTNAQPAQDTASGQPTQIQNTGRDDHGFNWGWLGLIGLAGLAGLKRREPAHTGRFATEAR
jgi:MYXO-CTERM domain-containing protein